MIATTLRHMATQVDELIVADNGSTDGTRYLLDELARELPLTVLDDLEPAYLQSAKMTRLAGMAGGFGAEWIVPFDADEIWYSNDGRIGDVLGEVGDGMAMVAAEVFDHVATGRDPAEPDPVRRMQWRRRDRLPLPKVAVRWRSDLTIHQGNHGADFGGVLPASQTLLVVRHFPYRSAEQLVRKVANGSAAYRAAGDLLPPDAGAHWRQWGAILDEHGPDAIGDLFRRWYWRADPTRDVIVEHERLRRLIHDPAPVA